VNKTSGFILFYSSDPIPTVSFDDIKNCLSIKENLFSELPITWVLSFWSVVVFISFGKIRACEHCQQSTVSDRRDGFLSASYGLSTTVSSTQHNSWM